MCSTGGYVYVDLMVPHVHPALPGALHRLRFKLLHRLRFKLLFLTHNAVPRSTLLSLFDLCFVL